MFQDPTFWFLVSFLIFIGLVAKPIKKVATDTLDGRSSNIETEIEDAVKLREEASRKLNDIRDQYAHAEKHAEEVMEHAILESERLKSEAGRELEDFLYRKEKTAEERILNAQAKATKQIQSEAITLALKSAESALQKMLDTTTDEQLIIEAIDQLKNG